MASPYLSQDNGVYRENYYSRLRETIRNAFHSAEASMIIWLGLMQLICLIHAYLFYKS